jgi:K+-transporting ATPase ATPase B chain
MAKNPRIPRNQRRHTTKVKHQGLYRRAIKQAFLKLDPRIAIKNPVMFLVWIGTIITTLVTINPTLFGDQPTENARFFNGLITLLLFFTVLFANFAEAVAEGRGKAQADALRATKSDTIARKVRPDGSLEEVNSTTLKKGDQIKVIAGDLIPADGEVIGGLASVDESAITGESAPVLKQPGTDIASSVTGGTRIISDELLIRVSVDPGKGFIDRMISNKNAQ